MKVTGLKIFFLLSLAVHFTVLSLGTLLLSPGNKPLLETSEEIIQAFVTDVPESPPEPSQEPPLDISGVAPEEFGPGSGPGPAPLGDGLLRDGFGEERPGPLPLGDSPFGGGGPKGDGRPLAGGGPALKEAPPAAKGETPPPDPVLSALSPLNHAENSQPAGEVQGASSFSGNPPAHGTGPVGGETETAATEEPGPTELMASLGTGGNGDIPVGTLPQREGNGEGSQISGGNSLPAGPSASLPAPSGSGDEKGAPGGTGKLPGILPGGTGTGDGTGTLGSKQGVPGGTGSGPGRGRAGSRFGVPGGTGGGRGGEMNQFVAMVRRKIEKAKFYPRAARSAGIEGRVGIRFLILPDGKVGEITLIQPSPHDTLSEAAKETIARAAPFRPRPKELEGQVLAMQIAIAFKLE